VFYPQNGGPSVSKLTIKRIVRPGPRKNRKKTEISWQMFPCDYFTGADNFTEITRKNQTVSWPMSPDFPENINCPSGSRLTQGPLETSVKIHRSEMADTDID